MKIFCVTYSYVTTTDQVVEAQNEKEARKKFREFMPGVIIDGVWETHPLEAAGDM